MQVVKGFSFHGKKGLSGGKLITEDVKSHRETLD